MAADVWSVLTPLLAARPRVRESRSGGHTYLRRWERPLTARLPAVPAAVPIYSAAGDTRVLVVDLDASRGGVGAVRRDAAAIRELVARAGGRVISDESPSGGVHVYVPLQQPIGFHEARDLALAMAARTPTMDPTPNQGLTDGLIRPPGSIHPTGGHQVLHGTLAAAHQVATAGNSPAVLGALRGLLAAELAAIPTRGATTAATGMDDVEYLPRRGGAREIATDYLRIATTGLYDAARYRSASEARQAVLVAAVSAGLTLPEVLGRIEGGAWPGLASFYTRYRQTGTRSKALLADWRKAIGFVATTPARRRNDREDSLVRKSPTSEPASHGGAPNPAIQDQLLRGSAGEYQWIRQWWTALSLVEHDRYDDRAGIARRFVLRAMGDAAMKTGSRYVAFGVRSLSVATGLDHTTVAAHLRALRNEPDPLIDLIEDDRGLQGDLYTLRIPDEVADRAARMSWRSGKIHALRPAFRELGHATAFVYEALEHQTAPTPSFDLVTVTGLSRTAVYEALQTLAAWNLAEQHAGRWSRVAGTSLRVLAEQFGCTDAVRVQVDRHRAERASYRRALRIVDQQIATIWPGDSRDPWPPPPEPPPDTETLLDLLERELGAHPIPVTATR